MRINPEHPVTQAANDNWHKIAMLMMVALGVSKVEIPGSLIEHLVARTEMPVVMLHDHGDSLTVLSMDSEAEARAYAKEHGLEL